jgi:RNA polymerase sigma-70 factor (ECF subfamily)
VTHQRPELVVTADAGAAPGDDVELVDAVGLAVVVVLESLGPSGRLAFVLHDLFAVPFDETAQILGQSTAAAKMLTSRARVVTVVDGRIAAITAVTDPARLASIDRLDPD